jgi:hypothetical protein
MQKLFKGMIVFIMFSLLIPSLLAGCSGGGSVQSPATDNAAVVTTSTDVSATSTKPVDADTYKNPEQSFIINYNNDPDLPVPANMLMLMVKDGTAKADVEKLAADIGGAIVGKFDFVGLYQIETNTTTQKDLDALIKKSSGYAFVEKSGPMMPVVDKDIAGVPCKILEDMYGDPKASSTYEMIGMERAWDLIRASGISLNKVTVGVVDSGLDADSSDGTKGTKIQVLDKNDAVKENNSHGTSVANTVGASWENGGMRGVAGGLGDKLTVNVSSLRKAKLEYTPVNVVNPQDTAQVYTAGNGQSYLVNTFDEIKKQIDAGAQVINYSQGSAKPGPQNAFDNAAYKKFLARMEKDYPKVVFVAAAGNEGIEKQTDPVTGKVTWVAGNPLDGNNYDMGGTKADNLITVGSLNSDGTNSVFTNTATGNGEVTLAAQGTKVALGTNADGTTYYASGTSFATPQVSGAAAILKSINPDLTAKEIKDILINSADTKITNPALLPKGVKEQAIDPGVGGRVMRLDNAVIDQLKKVMGDKFDLKKLENIAKVTAKAIADKSDPLHFTIDANVPAVKDTGADINVTFSGEGSLGGLSTQHIGAAGSLTWDWRFLSDKNTASIKVTRTDSGACSRISLKPNAMAGTYKGNLHVAFPAAAQMMSKSAFDLAATIVIDDAGAVKFTFADKGSVSQGGNGVSITVDYNAKGSMDGNASEDGKLTFAGGYSSTYKTNLPGGYAAMMPAAQRSLLSGTTTGSSEGTGTLADITITGSVVFNGDQGGSSTGTFKMEKVEEK